MAQIKAYNTKTGKYQVIHPSFAKNKVYLAQRGLILQEEAKPFKPTNIPNKAEPTPSSETATEPTNAKSKSSK